MKKIFPLIVLIALLSSCNYQAKRDIKAYENANHNKVSSIKVKQVSDGTLYVAKVKYKLQNGLTTVPVYHLYSWDRYGYIREWEDCELKFNTIEEVFPEATDECDYMIVKTLYNNKAERLESSSKAIMNDPRIVSIMTQIDSIKDIGYDLEDEFHMYLDMHEKMVDSARQETYRKQKVLKTSIDSLTMLGDSIAKEIRKTIYHGDN